MQSTDQTQRKEFMSQVSELDTTNMSTEELSSSLLSLLAPENEETNNNDSLLDLYV